MSRTRAKFRCLSITRDYSGATEVKLAPVYPGSPAATPAEFEENRQFWGATPSGEVRMRLSEGSTAAEAFTPGAFYWLDFTPCTPEESNGSAIG